jgi:hypothetical protein
MAANTNDHATVVDNASAAIGKKGLLICYQCAAGQKRANSKFQTIEVH